MRFRVHGAHFVAVRVRLEIERQQIKLRVTSYSCKNPMASPPLARPKVWRELLPRLSPAEQTMAMPAQRAPHRRWTEEEFYAARDAAPPGERWELVDGEALVTPSPHWV